MLNLVILCVTDKEHSKCFYGIQLIQSFVCIYSISEKHRFVKRYLENKIQDIVLKKLIILTNHYILCLLCVGVLSFASLRLFVLRSVLLIYVRRGKD